jgi:hypothetical protein
VPPRSGTPERGACCPATVDFVGRCRIDERLKRLAELFEFDDLTKNEYLARRSDLFIERDQVEAQPAGASIALQRQRLQSVVDDWPIMTDEEKKRVLQKLFRDPRRSHRERPKH